VLLEYVGAGHEIPSSADLQRRQLQFFDHFLKDAPAPAWWSDSRSYPKGQAPAANQ
jgi:hypothetical protein